MNQSEDALAMAERQVCESEQHVAHQLAIIDEFERDGHVAAAERARKVLVNLRISLEQARIFLRRVRMRREDALAMTTRHVRQAEEGVSHQLAIVEQLERHGHRDAAERARKVLATLQDSLELARKHRQRERTAAGL